MGFPLKTASLAVALAVAPASFADESTTEGLYSAIYVFGDSLSDSGNAGVFTNMDPDGDTPRQPAIAFTADRLGIPLRPSCFGLGPAFGGAIPCAPAPGTPEEQAAQVLQSLLANGTNWAVGGNRTADVLLDVVGPQRFRELFPDTTVADHNRLTTILPDSTRCGPDGVCDFAAGESPYLPPAEVLAAISAFNDPAALQALVDDPTNGIGLTGVPNASGQGFLQRNSVDPNALFYLNGGGNNIIANTLAGTVTPETMERAATFLTFAVAELSAAGADYIAVSNVPQVGNTPLMNGLGPAAVSAANIGTALFNEELRRQLVLLGRNALILDSAGIAALALERPALFGFADIDQDATCFLAGACANPDPVYSQLGSAPDPDRLFFYDGFHPTLAAQELLGDYYYSVLSAPVGFAMLPDLGYQNYRTHHTNIDHHLVAQRFREPTTTIFFGGAWQRTELDGGLAPQFDDSAWDGLFGFSFDAGENFEWALALSYGSTEYTPDNLWLEADNLNFSWIARWNDERWFVDGGLTYSDIDYDEIDRRIHLGQEFTTRVRAGADGDAAGVFVRGGYDTAPALPCQIGPFVSVEWTEVEVDSFREHTDPDLRYVSSISGESLDPIGLRVSGQDREYLRYRAGFFYNAPENAEWRWFGEVWVEGNDGDDYADVRVGLKSIRGNRAYLRAYDSDGRGFFQNGAGAMVGLNVTEKLQFSGNILVRPEDQVGGLNINYRF
ncbi:autotransporter outer membrane beta-barrel domain-containing protein [Microbulbifer yueqingensis]|uniref:Phospholipase/lecithinase/hemolysin n=1 Tax=Microbulbifer yueqingensis TaxID=658219 RepID=A0A1G8VUY1_9GAMM|nr:autotransporter domain-containing protein [Microbulbifer yueqingensis]SDJ69802.1 Phospholipase/lecithinase/hemolysin [Microbulbifer yueqingensis]